MSAIFRAALCLLLLAMPAWGNLLLTGAGSGAASTEEFVGPFPTWTNVKTACGATGNGSTDDTAAIQTCLNALSSSAPVLYFPAGTYKITSTLTLSAQQYISLMGADPATTTILWAGSSGGTMLDLNGTTYSRYDRLTFNGAATAAVIIDSAWQGPPANYADSGNEYTDDVFENAGTGFRCGYLGYQCSEISMLRDQFINNTVAGVAVRNANALDLYIWYSLFQNNYVGATNNPYGGMFEIYNSTFESSTFADIATANTGHFNFLNNYSIGSNRFISSGGTCDQDLFTIQGNTILDTTDSKSIYLADPGPMILLDNIVRSSVTDTTSPVVAIGNCIAELFSMGNTYTISPPYTVGGRKHSIQDQVVDRSTINPTMPTLPGTPPNLGRTIYEAATTGISTNPCSFASPCDPQTAITKAAVGCSNNVAHIEPGTYSVATTITVPTNCQVQIIGDGANSQLTAGGANPVIRLLGPSKATLLAFAVDGDANTADGIEVDNADQPGSHIFMEQSNLGASHTNLFVDGLDYTNVELHDFNHVYDSTTGMTSVIVTGGSSAGAGSWQGGATNVFAGSSAGNYIGYGVSNGAHVDITDTFNDAGAGGSFVASATGAFTTFTYAGSELYLPGTAPTAISLNNFQGTAALLNFITATGNIDISGTGSGAQNLGIGLVGTTSLGTHGTASGTTAFSDSVADNFIPAMVGNSLVISSGSCAAATYTIASVVDAGDITLNTSPGTCSNATWASGSAAFFSDTSSPADTSEFLIGLTTAASTNGASVAELPEVPTTPDTTFLTATLNQIRTTYPALPVLLPSSVTDVSFYRVQVSNAATGIHLEH